MEDIIRLEFKTIDELREKIRKLRENGFVIAEWDYFNFLNSRMNTIVASPGRNAISDKEYWLDYVGE